MVDPLLMSATASSAEAYSFEPPLFTAGAFWDLRIGVEVMLRQPATPRAFARGNRCGCAQIVGRAVKEARTSTRGRNWRVSEAIFAAQIATSTKRIFFEWTTRLGNSY